MVVPVMKFSGGSSKIGYDRDCINKNDTYTEKKHSIFENQTFNKNKMLLSTIYHFFLLKYHIFWPGSLFMSQSLSTKMSSPYTNKILNCLGT